MTPNTASNEYQWEYYRGWIDVALYRNGPRWVISEVALWLERNGRLAERDEVLRCAGRVR